MAEGAAGVLDSELGSSREAERVVEKEPKNLAVDWLKAASNHYEQKWKGGLSDKSAEGEELAKHFEEQIQGYNKDLEVVLQDETEENAVERSAIIKKYAMAEEERQKSIKEKNIDPLASQVQAVKPS